MPPRPKRPSTLSGSGNLDAAVRSGAGLPTHKRPKFDARNPHKLAPDAPSDDEAPDIFLEVDEGAIGKRRVHRNAVELEGYETDSSEEGFDATHKQWAKDGEKKKAKKEGEDMDDDDDMFGGEDMDDDAADNDDIGRTGEDAEYRKAKSVKFMNLNDIEGQDMSSTREFADIIDEDKGKGDESSTDDEEDPEKRAKLGEELDPELGAGSKKKHAPKIDAFNMKSEMEEGRFDSAGNFIRKAAEADAIHDKWLEGVSRKDMKRAKEAMEQREAEARERMKADDAILTSDVLATLISCLDRGESVLEALARLGGGKKKQSTANKNKNRWREKKKAAAEAKKNDGMEVDNTADSAKGKEPEDPEETRRKEAVERITGAADVLLTRGQLEIYEETKESLMRQYKRETGEEWVEKHKPSDDEAAPDAASEADKQWEYRWVDGRDDGSVYGPYGTTEMRSWNEHGFFGEGVEFREKAIGGEWSKVPGFL